MERKTVQISKEAHELARQKAFEDRKPIGAVISDVVKEKLKEERQQEKKK
jgi:hypothetical protein